MSKNAIATQCYSYR